MNRLMSFVLVMILATGLVNVRASEVRGAEEYIIAPADVLEISIWGEPELKRDQLVVRQDGNISFPLIGDLEVSGKTTEQVKQLIEANILPYVPQASATVIVSLPGSLRYYVIGKVAKPGMYQDAGGMSVIQALSLAGGLTPFAKASGITIMRTVGDKSICLPFNYDEVKKGKKLEQNIQLQRGDVVVVP
ncbi:MAG: polysaccharide biosynthesis/export family protein [Syntrophobacteraceae bacterium]